jgi:hypothetical protein
MEGEEVMSQHFGAYDSQETQDLYNNGPAPRRSPRKSPIKPVQPTEKKRKFKWLGGGMFNNPLFRGQFIYVLRSIVSIDSPTSRHFSLTATEATLGLPFSGDAASPLPYHRLGVSFCQRA